MSIDTSHSAVQAVERELRAHGIQGEVRWLDEATPTAAAAADSIGTVVGAIANSLVFTLDGEPVLVMTSGGHRVDTIPPVLPEMLTWLRGAMPGFNP